MTVDARIAAAERAAHQTVAQVLQPPWTTDEIIAALRTRRSQGTVLSGADQGLTYALVPFGLVQQAADRLATLQSLVRLAEGSS